MKESDSSEEDNAAAVPADVTCKKVTGDDADKWEVAGLNLGLGSSDRPSRSSDVFEKLANKRKARHEAVLEELDRRLQEINSKTEKNVRISSMEVKAHVADFGAKLEGILKSIDVPEVAAYDGSVFLELQNKANEYKALQRKMVTELFDDLNEFENERASQNARLLRSASEEVRKVGYFLPCQIQSFVESRALEMNQVSLNNRRIYEDSKLALTLLTEQTFRSFAEKTFCIQTKWARQKLQEAGSNSQNKAENRRAKAVPEVYGRLEIGGQQLRVEPGPDNLRCVCKVDEWEKNVRDGMAAVEGHARNLVELYKKTLNGALHGFDAEVDAARKKLTSVEPLAIEERVMKPITFEARDDGVKKVEGLELYWQETLFLARRTLKEVTEFLRGVGSLWDVHAERVCEAKKLILRALEKTQENSQGDLEELEVKLNVALDALRQEHNKPKLEKALSAVSAILESIKSKYESLYLSEVSVAEDFYGMMELEADLLSAELKEFTCATSAFDQSRNFYRLHDHLQSLPNEEPLFRKIQVCAQQIKAVKFWKKGVWSALETFSQRTREFLKTRAESWVQKKISILAEKKSVQVELARKRSERIQLEIFQKRLGEVECHEETLRRHKQAIKFVYAKMKEDLKSVASAESAKLDRVRESFGEIEAAARQENRPGVIRGNQIMMEKKKEEMGSRLKATFDRFRADCESKSCDLTEANAKFIKSIRLFHEDGNYSAEEGKAFAAALEAADKEIGSEWKNVARDAAKEENDLSRKLSAAFDPTISLFSALHEETSFHQEIQLKMRGFAEEIRGFATILRADFDALSRHVECLGAFEKSAEDFRGSHDYWQFVLRLLYRNVSNLFYPVALPDVSSDVKSPGENGSEEAEDEEGPCCCGGKFSLKASISKTPTFRTADVDESFTCKDFRKELFHFEDPPENDGTFMAVISNGLWAEMSSIQKLTCNFYKKLHGRKIVREDLIPGTYEEFVGEALARFRWYNLQCEELWLQIILNLLPVVADVKAAANRYSERVLDEYESAALAALKALQEDFFQCLESQSGDNARELAALARKLLPLHGYPKNKDLLRGLEEEVVRRTAGSGVKWDAAISRFKSRVKCFRLRHVHERREIDKIHSQALKLLDRIFVEDLGNNMLDLMLEYCERGGYWSRREAASKARAEADGGGAAEGKMPPEYDLRLELPEEKLDDVLPHLRRLRRAVDRERDPETTPPDSPAPSEGSRGFSAVLPEGPRSRCPGPKMNVLADRSDSGRRVEKILRRLKGHCGKMRTFAESQTGVHEEALFGWLAVWKSNVRKIERLYGVACEEAHGGEPDAPSPPPEKTSASVVPTPPKLCPTSKLNFKDTSCCKLTDFKNSDRVRFASNSSLILISPRNYHGQIPVFQRHSLNHLRMSPPVTRPPSPLKKAPPKEKPSNKVKTITLEQDGKKDAKTSGSRSPSPGRRSSASYKRSKEAKGSSSPGGSYKAAPRRADSTKQAASPRMNSPAKRKSKTKAFSSLNVDFALEASGKGEQRQKGDSKAVILKQASQPSLCKKEKLVEPQEKISLDHLKNEVYSGDHRRLSFEKVHLCIEKSVENSPLGESKRSYLVTYSSEDLQKQEEISLAILQNLRSSSVTTFSADPEKRLAQGVPESKSAIRTPSGHELQLTPSMKLDLEKSEIECEGIEISELLHECGENFEESKDVHILQDDANEYDSEVSTDGEAARKSRKHAAARTSGSKCSDAGRKSANSLWKTREAELLNDVDYRQSVYHPAVSRRQKDEKADLEFRPKSKSIENNFGYSGKAADRIIRSHSSNLKEKHGRHNFGVKKNSDANNQSSWGSTFNKSDGKQIYNSAIEDVPFYGVKKIRTKKERISGALLRFTLKIIRLLAIFNFWPGDNCHMLTSQSLRLAR